MKDPRTPADKEYVAGLEKGLAIIEAFGLHKGRLTLTEAAAITGHTRASSRRSLLTLQRLGYVEWDGKYFTLAPRTLRLGHAYVTSNALCRLVQPVLEATTERTREPSSVAVLDGIESVFVARAAARRSLSDGLGLGSRLPAWCSATGRVLLAEQDDEDIEFNLRRGVRRKLTPRTRTDLSELMDVVRATRMHGYAICDEELQLGLRSIAVPLRDGEGKAVAAMSLVASTSRMSLSDMIELLLPELESARRMLSHLY